MAAISLLLLTVAGLVLLTRGLPWWVPLFTFGCLGGVLVTGRRAAVAGVQRLPDAKPVPAAEAERVVQDEPPVPATESARTQSAKATAQPLTKAQLLRLPSRSAGARRPGISGRIVAGQTDFQLPEPLVITEVELGSVFSSGDNATATEPIPVAVDTPPAAPATVSEPQPDASAGKANWTPTPVPPPSYTLSGVAARWEPKALTEVDYAQASQAALRLTEEATEQARQAGVTHPETTSRGLPVRRIFSDKGIDLNKALDRRRTANS